jgi:hypothetical protein
MNRDSWNKIISEKRIQYDHLLKEKQVTNKEADDFIKRLEETPMQTSKECVFTLIYEDGRLFASQSSSNKSLRWILQEDGLMIALPFRGGDSIKIESQAEIYSAEADFIPVLPVQFPLVKSFVDFARDGDRTTVKMFAAALGSDQYVPAELQFEKGHLSEAYARAIERTRYSRYTTGIIPMPQKIVYEGRFSKSREPQLIRTFEGKPILKPKIPKIEDLVKAPIEVIDQRVEPHRQFTFIPGKGSILKQAENGRVIQNPRRLQDAPSEPMPFSTWLIGASLLLLIGVSIARIVQRRKSK